MAYNSNGMKKDWKDMEDRKREGARARRREDKFFATMEGWEEGDAPSWLELDASDYNAEVLTDFWSPSVADVNAGNLHGKGGYCCELCADELWYEGTGPAPAGVDAYNWNDDDGGQEEEYRRMEEEWYRREEEYYYGRG